MAWKTKILPKNAYKRLQRLNGLVGTLLLGQGVAIILLASHFSLPVITTFLTPNPYTGGVYPARQLLFSIWYMPLLAIILLLPAILHLLEATKLKKRYDKGLRKGTNGLRWLEAGVTSSLAVVLVAMLVGVYELSLLLTLVVLTGLVNLGWYWLEALGDKRPKRLWPVFGVAKFVAYMPWIVMAIYFTYAITSKASAVPGFFYWLYGIMVGLTVLMVTHTWLRFKPVKAWKNYLFVEAGYIILSLVTKSTLAWFLFAKVLK